MPRLLCLKLLIVAASVAAAAPQTIVDQTESVSSNTLTYALDVTPFSVEHEVRQRPRLRVVGAQVAVRVNDWRRGDAFAEGRPEWVHRGLLGRLSSLLRTSLTAARWRPSSVEMGRTSYPWQRP